MSSIDRLPKRSVAALLALLAGCAPPTQAITAGSPRVSTTPTLPTAEPSSSARVEAPLRLPRSATTSPLWQAARGNDPLDKARLATAVGAAGLLDVVHAGGESAETALAALAFAEDGEVVLGGLAEIAAQPTPRRRLALLAILGIAERLHHSRERLDPEGARGCGAVVLTLARDDRAEPEDRRLAARATRALAERGYADARSLP